MPLVKARLQKTLEASISAEFKKSIKGSKKTKYLTQLCEGIAQGFCAHVIGSTGTITPTGGVGSFGIGIQGVNIATLAGLIQANMKKTFEAEGVAGMPLAIGTAKSIVAELLQATVTGAAAGVVNGIKGWQADQMANSMLIGTKFEPTEHNRKFFKVLAESITSEIQSKGTAIIPPVGPGSGPPIAIIS